jgi:hypothetical protein
LAVSVYKIDQGTAELKGAQAVDSLAQIKKTEYRNHEESLISALAVISSHLFSPSFFVHAKAKTHL